MVLAPRPRAETRRTRQAGFLLTETLATFTISAFVLLGLVSAATVLLGAVDRSVTRVQEVEELGRTVAAITREVSGLARARWNGKEPQAFVFRGGPNSLFFASWRRKPDGTRDANVVALREIVAGTQTRLMRAEAPLPAQANGFGGIHFGPQRELGTGPARLRLYYLAAAGEDGGQGRLRAWPMGPSLPAAIIIEAIDRSNGQILVSARAAIRANADIGCLAGDDAQSSPASPSPNAGVADPNTSKAGFGAQASAGALPDAAAPPSTIAGPGGGGSSNGAGNFCGRADKANTKDGGNRVAATPATGRTP